MTINDSKSKQPTDPTRVRAFARFFKNYMSISAMVVAALPIPVTAFKLIPTFSAQRGYLSVYTSLFCFLLLGFIFYNRLLLAKLMFTGVGSISTLSIRQFANNFIRSLITWLPFILICLSMLSVLQYHLILDASIAKLRNKITERSRIYQEMEDTVTFLSKIMEKGEFTIEGYSDNSKKTIVISNDTLKIENFVKAANLVKDEYQNIAEEKQSAKKILETTDSDQIPVLEDSQFIPEWSKGGALLAFFYLTIFLSAEAAFILMALKEYVQDLLGLEDVDLIVSKRVKASK